MSTRLAARDVEPVDQRRLAGDGLQFRDRASQDVRRLRAAHPGPNAPLLIRLVRHPYALETVRARRNDAETRGLAGAPRARLEPRTPLTQVAAEAKGDLLPGNPLRTELVFEPPPRLKHPLLNWALSAPRTKAADPLEIVVPWKKRGSR